MQTEINDFKGKIMSNIAATRDSSNIVAAMINAGIFKSSKLEDIITEINHLRNKFLEWHLEGISEIQQLQQQKQEERKEEGTATDNQRKAVWAIIHGRDGTPDLEQELSCDIDDISFQEASDFIERYGKKSLKTRNYSLSR